MLPHAMPQRRGDNNTAHAALERAATQHTLRCSTEESFPRTADVAFSRYSWQCSYRSSGKTVAAQVPAHALRVAPVPGRAGVAGSGIARVSRVQRWGGIDSDRLAHPPVPKVAM
jgi:hypothetical protein